MQLHLLTVALYALSFASAAPQSQPNSDALAVRDTPLSQFSSLEKRKGGGGGRSSGGGSSGGSSSSSGRTGSTSNSGGRTSTGSGSPPAYGNRYSGGATVPYTSGPSAVSPTRRILPFALPIAAVAIFPALWLWPVYAYPYPIGYHWYENGRNRTSNVTCLCQEYSVCGCDPDDNSTFLTQTMTNGSTTNGPPVNTSTVRTVEYENGTIASYINGTLDNGTTAAGGTDSSSTRLMVNYGGYWIMVATVVLGVTMI